MDLKTAMKILSIDERATFDEARQAYRRLAKQYHPDMFHSAGESANDQKMKEINRAFFILGPVLRKKRSPSFRHQPDESGNRPNASSTSRNGKKEDKRKDPTLSEILARLVKKMADRVKKQAQATSKNGRPPHDARKRKVADATEKRSNGFEQVFKTVYTRPASTQKNGIESKNRSRKQRQKSSYRGYETYVALKKKMRAARRRGNSKVSVPRVEKIEPIRPVNPVHRD